MRPHLFVVVCRRQWLRSQKTVSELRSEGGRVGDWLSSESVVAEDWRRSKVVGDWRSEVVG
jgi:hypothetical protein